MQNKSITASIPVEYRDAVDNYIHRMRLAGKKVRPGDVHRMCAKWLDRKAVKGG